MDFKCPNCNHQMKIADTVDSAEVSCPSCGSRFSVADSTMSTVAFAPDLPSLAHFDLIENIGAGQFGTVWKAKDRKLNRFVAVKVPHRDNLSASDTEFIMREARTAGQLEHANIVTVHEVVHENDSMVIVSQYIDGITLSDWCQVNRLTNDDAAALMAKICRAIDFAHEKGIVHRDIKPTNILMDADGEPFVTDFGLAKRDLVETTISIDGRILGTPAYMSPEQARGEGQLADRRSDVYSVGVMLYEQLAGRRPFKGGRRLMLQQVIHDPPRPPRAIKKSIAKDLETICLKALEKDPDKRYQTALAMAEDLDRFAKGEPIVARPIGLVEKVTRSAKRYPGRYAIGVLGTVSVLLLGLLIAQLGGSDDSDKATSDRASDDAMDRSFMLDLPPGARPVSISTSSDRATVLFYPVVGNGGILTEEKVTLGEHDGETWLAPGDYLVVAYEDDDTFHEVLRRVPEPGDGNGMYVGNSFELDGDTVVLPEIKLFDQDDVCEGMVAVGAGRLMEANESSPLIDAFYVDPTEYPGIRFLPWSELDWPRCNVSWYKSMELAEESGKRLLYEDEYTYLITSGGQFDYPWGDEPHPSAPFWKLTPLRFNELDVLEWSRADGPIWGLFSGALEWTFREVSAAEIPYRSHLVRGGPAGFPPDHDGPALTRQTDKGLSPVGSRLPNLGFRQGRSSAPLIK